MGPLLCREIVTGKPLPLISKFRLSYYTLLNILRRLEGSGQSMEYVIARSFQQFQFEQSLPQVRWPVVACTVRIAWPTNCRHVVSHLIQCMGVVRI